MSDKNTFTGLRYLCFGCSIGSKVVKHFPSITGGKCRICKTYIPEGEETYILDTGVRLNEEGRWEVDDSIPVSDLVYFYRQKHILPFMEAGVVG